MKTVGTPAAGVDALLLTKDLGLAELAKLTAQVEPRGEALRQSELATLGPRARFATLEN